MLARDLLDSGLHVRFRASGRSMAPAVRDGDVVVVAPIDPVRVAVGDVIFCDTWRGPLAHRVTSIEGRDARDARDDQRRFVLRGDRSLEDDAPVTAAQVRGRLVAVERDGRIDRTGFAGGVWRLHLRTARARCRHALLRASQSARTAVALLRPV